MNLIKKSLGRIIENTFARSFQEELRLPRGNVREREFRASWCAICLQVVQRVVLGPVEAFCQVLRVEREVAWMKNPGPG